MNYVLKIKRQQSSGTVITLATQRMSRSTTEAQAIAHAELIVKTRPQAIVEILVDEGGLGLVGPIHVTR